MPKVLSFNSMVSDYEIVNPEFARVKVYVCYAGKNRNMSSIDEQVLEKMSQSIYGVPMVAEYDKEHNCFKGHGGKIEITDEGIDFVETTVPYGFVDPKTPVFYEEVTELDGITKHNYLCCYAYLWYKRYPEVESVLKNQDNKKIGQSMEIQVDSYEIDEDGYCVIKDGYFSALAMLGVEPCFETASVTSKFSKDESDIWEEMINSFKKFSAEDEAEDDEEEFKRKKKCSEDEDKDSEHDDNEDEEFKKRKKCSEDEDNEDEEDFKKKKKCSEDEDEEFKKKKKCSEDEDEEEEYKKKRKCSEDENDEDEEFKKKKKCAEDEEDEEDEEFKKKKKCSSEEYEAKISELMEEYSTLSSEYHALIEKYNALESEVLELRAYKEEKEHEAREIELEEEVFSKFEDLKQIEGYKDIYDARFELSKEDLTIRLKALAFDNGIVIGKKETKKFSKQSKKSLVVEPKQKNRVPSEWDTLIFRGK